MSRIELLLVQNRTSTESELIQLISKQTSIIASKGPLEFQAVQSLDTLGDVDDAPYDPSDEAEIARINGRSGVNADFNGPYGHFGDFGVGQEPFVFQPPS